MLYELGLHNVELPSAAPSVTDTSKIIIWHEGQIVMNDHDIAWPISTLAVQPADIEFVGLLNGKSYFTGTIAKLLCGGSAMSLREVAFTGETAFMLCARARAMLEWRLQHKYCGQCAQTTTQVEGEFAMQCEPCRLRYYPRIAPCIIVLITDGRRVLLAQGERQRDRGWYSTLAGFIEAGESAEQAVIREVKEEVNVDVTNIRYLNSQAWPFPNQLMLGFHADYNGGDIVPQAGEIADAQWFDIDDLPKHPPSISIAGWLIRQYRDSLD